MSDTRKMLVSFDPTFGNIDMVRAAVRGICADFFGLAPTVPSIMDFCLIVTELMNNAVEHVGAGLLEAEILLSDNEAAFRLITGGAGFDPTRTAKMPDLEPDQELPDGGYGLALIQALADGMEYEYRENRNMVTLRKNFPGKAQEE